MTRYRILPGASTIFGIPNFGGTSKLSRVLNIAGLSTIAAGSKFGGLALAAAVAFGLAGPATAQENPFGAFEPPAGGLPPALDPTGVQLQTQELAPGVYALISSRPPVDNSGFIVGENGVLVVDAHINGTMARQIQAAVRAVTDKPILYLVNTNYHGDHTFGNYAFPTTPSGIMRSRPPPRSLPIG